MPEGISPLAGDVELQAANNRILNDAVEDLFHEIWVTPGDFDYKSGTSIGVVGSRYSGIDFHPSLHEFAVANLRFWPWWTNGQIGDIKLWIACDAASSGNAKWQILAGNRGAGGDLTTGDYSSSVTTAVPTAADELALVTGFSNWTGILTDGLIGLRVERLGNDAADTCSDDLFLLGLSARFYPVAHR